MTAVDLTVRETFPHWTTDLIRFADLDRLGHVNNIAFAVYAETGRVDFLETVSSGSLSGAGIGWVIVKLHIDFLAQAHYPGRVEIGTRVLKLGRSSCTLGQGLFESGRCFGRVDSVCVWADFHNGKSLPLPGPIRTALEGYMRPGAHVLQ